MIKKSVLDLVGSSNMKSKKMKSDKRNERIDVIVKSICGSNKELSVDELLKIVNEKHKIKVSRKTIERDVQEIIEKGVFILGSTKPITVQKHGISECIMHLSHEDITYLMVILPENHSLNKRLREFMGIDNICPDIELEINKPTTGGNK